MGTYLTALGKIKGLAIFLFHLKDLAIKTSLNRQ